MRVIIIIRLTRCFYRINATLPSQTVLQGSLASWLLAVHWSCSTVHECRFLDFCSVPREQRSPEGLSFLLALRSHCVQLSLFAANLTTHTHFFLGMPLLQVPGSCFTAGCAHQAVKLCSKSTAEQQLIFQNRTCCWVSERQTASV